MKKAKEHPLSLWAILTRNAVLFGVMMSSLMVGGVVYVLGWHMINFGFGRIRADRLGFIFLILFASCYLPLLFIWLKRYWANFFAQLGASLCLFFILLFIFNPVVNVKLIWRDDTHVEFSTRSWSKVQVMPVRSNIAYFTWLQLPDPNNQIFPNGVVCLAKQISYVGNFVMTVHHQLPYANYMDDQGKLGMACNNETFHLIGQTVNLEKALMNENYVLFEQLDIMMQEEPWYNKPLVVTVDQLPTQLRNKLYQYADALGYKREKLLIRPAFIQAILEE